MEYYFTYVLLSLKDLKFYTGFTSTLEKRIELHNQGKVNSTKYRQPLKLVYFEGCVNQVDALKRKNILNHRMGKDIFATELEIT